MVKTLKQWHFIKSEHSNTHILVSNYHSPLKRTRTCRPLHLWSDPGNLMCMKQRNLQTLVRPYQKDRGSSPKVHSAAKLLIFLSLFTFWIEKQRARENAPRMKPRQGWTKPKTESKSSTQMSQVENGNLVH